MTIRKVFFAAGLFAAVLQISAQVPAAIATDPVPDKANPATMETVQIPSHGAFMNGLVYVPAGAGPHGVVILLHGFPGNEKNLDLAQAIRRAGWDVLYFDYRGSWGTPGAFSFTHAMEDTLAAIAYVRDPAVAQKLRIDSARIVLVGHSMGGFMAAYAGAQDQKILGVALISAWDIGGEVKLPPNASPETKRQMVSAVAKGLAEKGLAPLAGCTAQSLAEELVDRAAEWRLAGFAAKLAVHPVLVITSDDGGAPASNALVAGLAQAGDQEVNSVHIATDHPYSGKRIELEATVLDGLDYLQQHPR
jgi:pimeloyl-ACP methyl ester carboxylesterase